jgi:flagellar hook-length control protein FliK
MPMASTPQRAANAQTQLPSPFALEQGAPGATNFAGDNPRQDRDGDEDATPMKAAEKAAFAVAPMGFHQLMETGAAGTSTHRPMVAPHIIEQIVSSAKVTLRDGVQELTLRLDPPDLGPLHLQMTLTPTGDVIAHITTVDPAVRSMLEAHMPELHRSLVEAGIQVGQCTVSLDMSAQQGGGQAAQQSPSWGGLGQQARQGTARQGHELAPDVPEAPVAQRSLQRHQTVDYFA